MNPRGTKPRPRTAASRTTALLLTLGFAAATASAATVTVDAKRRGDAIEIHASAELRTDAASAWRVLTDYDRYAEFLPDLHASRVVARSGNHVTVAQSGDATLWVLRMPLDITFEIEETPPHRIRSRAVAGSLRSLASDYALLPTEGGVRLEYAGHVTPGFALFGYLEEVAVRDNVTRQFQALADEIERRGAARY